MMSGIQAVCRCEASSATCRQLLCGLPEIAAHLIIVAAVEIT